MSDIVTDEILTPKETIYINNLNDKVSIPKLKASLQEIFTKYGNIIQITAHKNIRMKGQAFITFDNKESSSVALNELQNYNLFNKEIHIQYAKSNSDNYHSQITKDDKLINNRKAHKEETKLKRKAEFDDKISQITSKSKKTKITKEFNKLPPNKVLLLQNITQEINITNEIISEFFNKFDGFNNSRYLKVRNLSFIEFEDTELSSNCLDTLDKEKLTTTFGKNVLLTFAKK